MNRRKFVKLIGLGGIGATGLISYYIFGKKESKNAEGQGFTDNRPEVILPGMAKNISVETALNSRCTSDYDGDPRKFHWGLFDNSKKLTIEQIQDIIHHANIPRFSDKRVTIQSNENTLTFIVDKKTDGILRDWSMVESGMQQQAIGLVCAALGAGMAFRNLGENGTTISGNDYGTVKIKLDPMKPTYEGSFWSSRTPEDFGHWIKGNLPNPDRNGSKLLLSIMSNPKIENKGVVQPSVKSISQLLWAARGRTPHYYKSKPWGMTIPTWAGRQNITSVYFISEDKLHKYINWNNGKSTHALQELDTVERRLCNEVLRTFSPNRGVFVLGKNEAYNRAFWEVGYQMQNLILQANSLDLSYRAVLLNDQQKIPIKRVGIADPVAILSI